MKNTVQYCMPLPVFVDVFDSRWSIVAHKNDTRFMSKASFLDTIRAQLGSTPDFVAARPHDLETRKGLLWTKQTEYKTLWALPLYHLPQSFLKRFTTNRKQDKTHKHVMSTFQQSVQTDRCVVATGFCAAVAVVVIVLFFVHPTCNGTCHIKRWWWAAGPYVFSHRGEGRVHTADFFQVSVVFKQAVSGPRPCSNGQALIPCLNEQKTQAWSSPFCLNSVFKGFVHPKEKLSSHFLLGIFVQFLKGLCPGYCQSSFLFSP